MPIHFLSPGTLDLRLISTFGVNVKPSTDSPIGYFGTGLKYAIAVLLREGAKIMLQTGGEEYSFFTKKDAIRGKDFDLCYFSGTNAGPAPLPFTLELGKDWTLENAYRELFSNTKDEHGRVLDSPSAKPGPGFETVISVGLEDFTEVHNNRASFILSEGLPRLFKDPSLGEILPFTSEQVFYRGIAAYKLPRPSVFTYNITRPMSLTENRTMYGWEVDHALANLLGTCDQEGIIKSALLDEQKYEHSLTFTYSKKSEIFLSTIGKLVKTHGQTLAPSATRAFFASARAPLEYKEEPPTIAQFQALRDAKTLILSCGIPVSLYPVTVSLHLGENVLAHAYQGKIWLTPKCFDSQELLLAAILEEYVHLRYGVVDETRAMQSAIFTLLVKVIQEKGSPHGTTSV